MPQFIVCCSMAAFSHIAWHQTYSMTQNCLHRVRIELTTFRFLCSHLDYETDALPTALPRPLAKYQNKNLPKTLGVFEVLLLPRPNSAIKTIVLGYMKENKSPLVFIPFGATRRILASLTLHWAGEQSGAVGACWAHNPEVGRSKLLSAKTFSLICHSPIVKPVKNCWKCILITKCQVIRTVFWVESCRFGVDGFLTFLVISQMKMVYCVK